MKIQDPVEYQWLLALEKPFAVYECYVQETEMWSETRPILVVKFPYFSSASEDQES